MAEETVSLSRDVTGVKIPSGDPIEMKQGSPVTITQSFGGSYTVFYANAYLVRIGGKDADALGKEATAEADSAAPGVAEEISEQNVYDKLRLVFDPEIPVNIVDLGLVYDCSIAALPDGKRKVDVKMTLTAPGCGMGPVIAGDAREKVMSLPGVGEANVELVWSPPWNQGMISEVGKMQLGLI